MWKSAKLSMKNIESIMNELKAGLCYCETEREAAMGLENESHKLPLIDRLGNNCILNSFFITIFHTILIIYEYIDEFLGEATGRYNEIYVLCEKVNKILVKTQLFISDTVMSSLDNSDDPFETFFKMWIQFGDSYRRALNDNFEWKRLDEKAATANASSMNKKNKRTSRIDVNIGVNNKDKTFDTTSARGKGESSMVLQLKAQMTKLRRHVEATIDETAILLEGTEDDDLI
jgi:hypothetical protein